MGVTPEIELAKPSTPAGAHAGVDRHASPVRASGSFGAQRGRSEIWRMRRAPLLCDTQFAIDCGGGGTRCTMPRPHNAKPIWNEGRRVRWCRRDVARPPRDCAGIPRATAHHFLFVAERIGPPTRSVCKRALRLGVVVRKAANGLRSRRRAQAYAAVRSVAGVPEANGRSVLGDIRGAPATASAREAAAPVG